MRYSGQEYFWVNDHTPTMIMHPMKPELENTDVSHTRDPEGVYIFREVHPDRPGERIGLRRLHVAQAG